MNKIKIIIIEVFLYCHSLSLILSLNEQTNLLYIIIIALIILL
jgi:hypothetical protein